MKKPVLVLALALAQCSSSPPPRPVAPPPPADAGPPAPTVDLSAVAPPAQLLATIRLPSPQGLATRIERALGLGQLLSLSFGQALPGLFGGDGAMAQAIDRAGPVDLALYHPGRGDPRLVVSLSTVGAAQARALLSDAHTLEAAGNGAVRIKPRAPAERREGAPECLLAPAFGTPDARLVCAERFAWAEAMLPYLTRTVPRTPLTTEEGYLVATAAVEQLQENLAADARRVPDRAVRDLRVPADPNNPQFQHAMEEWVRGFAGNLAPGLADLSAAQLTVALPATGLEGTLDVAVRSTTAPLLRQALDATRDAHPPVDLVARLPAGGWLYGATALGLEPFRAWLNLGAQATGAALVPRATLRAPDATALHDAIASLFAQDRVGAAAALGLDDHGVPWTAAALQLSTPPAQFVANVRTFVAAVHRPAIARAIRAEHHLDIARWREVRAAGLPAGTLLLRGPTQGLLDPVPPGAATMEVLLVPQDQNLWVVLAPDARARWRAMQTPAQPPVDPALFQGEGVAATVVLLPAGLAHLPRSRDPMVSFLQNAAQHATGAAPLVYRYATALRDGATHLVLRASAPESTLRVLGSELARSLGLPVPSSAP